MLASHHFHSHDWLTRQCMTLKVHLWFSLILNKHGRLILRYHLDWATHLSLGTRPYWILKPGSYPGR